MASSCTVRERFARRIASRDASLRLYAILDAESCARQGLQPADLARTWRDAGVCLLQYRDKTGSDHGVLRVAESIASVFRTEQSILLLNDRVHLLQRSGWDGVHVGQGDMPTAKAREQIGDDAILGLSTHTPEQAELAGREDVDYVAIGPVFGTTTKLNAEPVVGLCGLQAVRALVRKPLVAIGGITADRAPGVLSVGSNAVAVIGGLLVGDPRDCIVGFLRSVGR